MNFINYIILPITIFELLFAAEKGKAPFVIEFVGLEELSSTLNSSHILAIINMMEELTLFALVIILITIRRTLIKRNEKRIRKEEY